MKSNAVSCIVYAVRIKTLYCCYQYHCQDERKIMLVYWVNILKRSESLETLACTYIPFVNVNLEPPSYLQAKLI